MSIGQYLKENRLHRRLSREEASETLHIRPEYIAALEEDEWDKLPGEVYGQGFLKSYARLLEVDAAALVEYRKRLAGIHGGSGRAPAIRRVEAPRSTPSRGGRTRTKGVAVERKAASPVAIVVVLIILVGLFIAGIFLLPAHTPKTSPKTSSATIPHHHAKSPKKHHHGASATSHTPSPPVARVKMVSNDVARGIVSYKVTAPPKLTLTFSGSCWVSYTLDGVTKNPSGKIYQSGQTVTLDASQSLTINLGTRNLAVSVNGSSLALPDPGDTILHLTFTRG